MPTRLKDRLVCYILVLCLHLEDFNFEIDYLMEDLQLPKKKCVFQCSVMLNLRLSCVIDCTCTVVMFCELCFSLRIICWCL